MHTHERVRLRASTTQLPRQRRAATRQLRVRHARLAAHRRHAIRRAIALRHDQTVQRRRLVDRAIRAVPLVHHRPTIRLRHIARLSQRHVRTRRHALQRRPHRRAQTLRHPALDQVLAMRHAHHDRSVRARPAHAARLEARLLHAAHALDPHAARCIVVDRVVLEHEPASHQIAARHAAAAARRRRRLPTRHPAQIAQRARLRVDRPHRLPTRCALAGSHSHRQRVDQHAAHAIRVLHAARTTRHCAAVHHVVAAREHTQRRRPRALHHRPHRHARRPRALVHATRRLALHALLVRPVHMTIRLATTPRTRQLRRRRHIAQQRREVRPTRRRVLRSRPLHHTPRRPHIDRRRRLRSTRAATQRPRRRCDRAHDQRLRPSVQQHVMHLDAQQPGVLLDSHRPQLGSHSA